MSSSYCHLLLVIYRHLITFSCKVRWESTFLEKVQEEAPRTPDRWQPSHGPCPWLFPGWRIAPWGFVVPWRMERKMPLFLTVIWFTVQVVSLQGLLTRSGGQLTAEKIQPDSALHVKGRKGFAYPAEGWHELGTQSRSIECILASRHRYGQVGMLADMITMSPVSPLTEWQCRMREVEGTWTKSENPCHLPFPCLYPCYSHLSLHKSCVSQHIVLIQ